MKAKHAYLILAHANFGQLRKLISLLDHPRNDIYVHVDAKARNFSPEKISDVARHSRVVFLQKRIKVHWGGVSIMRAELELLKAATADGYHDYYHLISGMDLPIKTQDYIHAFFDANKGKEFIELWEFKKSHLSRFRYYTLIPEGERPFYTRILNHAFKGIQIAAGYRINRDVDFHIGAQWFSITDSFARYVVEHEDWLERVFRHTSICDEVFMATLVCNSPFRDRLYVPTKVRSQKEHTPANMRFIDWTRGDSIRHPWTFLASDMPLLESVEHLWARKFDERVDAEIITKICNKLNG